MIMDPMADKIMPKELQARKDEYAIIDVREADELEEEEGKIDEAINMPLGRLIRKARHGDLNDKIKRNLIYAFAYNVILIPIAATGILYPAFAGVAMAASSVSVTMSSLALKRWIPKSKRKRIACEFSVNR